MKYTEKERLEIGRQVYTKALSRKEAAEKYSVSDSMIDVYVNLYKHSEGIPCATLARYREKSQEYEETAPKPVMKRKDVDIEAYMAMTKEELINELILAKVNEARAKKGYEVKGVGADKVFVPLNRKNTK